MKINYKKLIFCLVVPLGLGFIVGMLSGSMDGYKNMVTPSFAPPGIVFPIVWSILYILMGISNYLVKEELNTNSALSIYNIQLGVNLLWSFFFFTFKWYLFSFIWILLLISLVYVMIREFLKVKKIAGYLQIPYLLWIIFAAILNFSIFLLN